MGYYFNLILFLCTFCGLKDKYRLQNTAHRRFRGIEWRVLKICDFKKVIFSLFFKHNIAGLGVLIPKRYHIISYLFLLVLSFYRCPKAGFVPPSCLKMQKKNILGEKMGKKIFGAHFKISSYKCSLRIYIDFYHYYVI